jgi:aminoglycoside phosphotransferase (APT) family kinase protein
MKIHKWKEIIPASKHEAVTKALKQAFGTAEVEEITPLTGGRSSALVTKVMVNGQPYVMRLVMLIDELRNPARQFATMNAAAAAGIAPWVRYTSAEDAISIVDFIEHSSISVALPSEKELFCALASSIQSIHALPLFPKLVDFLDGVDLFIEGCKASNILPVASTEEVFRYYSTIQSIYPRHEDDLVSSHNDLNPGNLLHNNGRIWIVDWEVAFANDRYVDLACANIFFGAGEAGEETLLETYFGEALNEYHRARFFLMRQVCFMYVSMLFMHLVGVMREPGSVFDPCMETMRLREFHCGLRSGEITMSTPSEHLVYAKVMLNESLSQMKTARFDEAIRLLQSQRH